MVVVGAGGLARPGSRRARRRRRWGFSTLELYGSHRARPAAARRNEACGLRAGCGGAESVETIMWLAMRGALAPNIRELHRNYYLATSTAMAVTLYEGEVPQ